MARLFGTDGVRGLAGRDITVELALNLARSAAAVLGAEAKQAGARPVAVIAHDPRVSSDFISHAVASGLAASGVDVFDAGVLPTPAAAYLTADLGADFGVMISASHNGASDNGIKFLARGGHKLPDSVEDEIESGLLAESINAVGAEVGRISRFADAEDRYLLHLLGTLRHNLQGLKVVLDCANGAASGPAPQAFTDAGAEVIVIGAEPDGMNINLGCGSTHLSALQSAVLEHSANLGIAFDGDADRALAVDETGAIVDGDQMMTILTLAAQSRGELARNTLVATVMSNLGLSKVMKENKIELHQTKVGDRYVLEHMRNGGFTLGGEQSGHIIFSAHATTGDGILTGLQLASEVAATGQSLSSLASQMTVFPQVLINVPGVDKNKVQDKELAAFVATAEAELADTGRVLLRASGTESLIRVMVEASDIGTAQSWAERIANKVTERLAL